MNKLAPVSGCRQRQLVPQIVKAQVLRSKQHRPFRTGAVSIHAHALNAVALISREHAAPEGRHGFAGVCGFEKGVRLARLPYDRQGAGGLRRGRWRWW